MGTAPSAARIYLARVVDAVVYGALVALVVSLVGAVVGLLVFGSLNGTKLLLFVAGFAQITVAVVSLWPSDVSDLEGSNAPDPEEVSRVQLLVDRIVPKERLGLPVQERFEHGVRQFVAGVAILAVSFSMEAVFGIAA